MPGSGESFGVGAAERAFKPAHHSEALFPLRPARRDRSVRVEAGEVMLGISRVA